MKKNHLKIMVGVLAAALTCGLFHAEAASSGEKTLFYWNALNTILQKYAQAYQAPPPRGKEALIAHYQKFKQLTEEWAGQIEGLPEALVDEEALSLARQHAQWLRKEASLYQAKEKYTAMKGQQVGSGQGALAQKAAEIATLQDEIDREKEDLGFKNDKLRSDLSKRYKIHFPFLE